MIEFNHPMWWIEKYLARKRAETTREPDGMKYCPECDQVLEVENNFNKDGHTKDGYHSACKHCHSVTAYQYIKEDTNET